MNRMRLESRARVIRAQGVGLAILLTLSFIVPSENMRAQANFHFFAKVVTPMNRESSIRCQSCPSSAKDTVCKQSEHFHDSLHVGDQEDQENCAREIQEIRRQLNQGQNEPLAGLFDNAQQAEQQFAKALKQQILADSPNPVPVPHGHAWQASHDEYLPPGAQTRNQLPPGANTERVDAPGRTDHSPPFSGFLRGRTPAPNRNHSQDVSGRPPQQVANPPTWEMARMQNFNPMAHQPGRDPSSPFGPSNPEWETKNSLRSAARRLEEVAAQLEELGLYEEADQARQSAINVWRKARSESNPDRREP